MDAELEEFKRLDLRAYAASLGYTLDRQESWRGSAVMRNAADDKIIIKRENDGHYVYFNVRDDADNGTIIDFALRRKCRSLGGVRKELRPWIGAMIEDPAFRRPLEKSSADRGRVERALHRMHAPEHHPLSRADARHLPCPARVAALCRHDFHGQLSQRGLSACR